MVPVILHADMDAFYAAIEQRDRAELRGRPVVVGGLGRRGVVSTASYEARVFGVRSAMPTAQARRLCPQGVFVTPRMTAYATVSSQVQAVFERYTDLVEPLSLDEAFLDVTGSGRLFGDGSQIADQIRHDVRRETGLTVSVGVATSKFVAKVASDLDKPDGLTCVPAGGEAEFLAPLPVSRLWGAGRVTQQRLTDGGLNTIGDVQSCSLSTLVALFGERGGAHYHALAHGRDERPIVPSREAKSVSRETTFEQDVNDEARLSKVLLSQSEDVGRRLRRAGLVGTTVRLKLRYPPFETLTRQSSLPVPSADDLVIYRTARELLERTRPMRQPVRLLGVGVAELSSADRPAQRELFGTGSGSMQHIASTLDQIRDRFGASAARHGGPMDGRG